jgi:hypothetical protein
MSGGETVQVARGKTQTTKEQLEYFEQWKTAMEFADYAPIAEITAMLGPQGESRHQAVLTKMQDKTLWPQIDEWMRAAGALPGPEDTGATPVAAPSGDVGQGS